MLVPGSAIASEEEIFIQKTHKKNNKKLIFPLIGVIFILIVILIFLLSPSGDDLHHIPPNVSISGIPVGNLTAEEATAKINRTLDRPWESHEFVLQLPNQKHILSPSDTKIHWDVDSAVKYATSLPDCSCADIPVELALDTDYIYEALETYAEALGGIYSSSGYWLEGDTPDFTNPESSGQTLVLAKGKAGIPLDISLLCSQVLDAYRNNIFFVSVDNIGSIQYPAALDLEYIYKQLSVSPINPLLDHNSLEVIPGKQGYTFDLENAATLLEQAAPGESVRIPMLMVNPEIDEADVWFQDVLGSCSTPHSDNPDRTDNLILACSKINGIIIQPGEIFSYNEVLGERTVSAGYKPAPAYSGTELVESIGGGICQVSSTLYLSSLFAELRTPERYNHGYPVDYIPLGLDATVNWGTSDLKIRNDQELPVKIYADVSDGFVHVRIMGVERRNYYVMMEYRVDDPKYACAYKCLCDKETDEIIDRTLHHTSIYLHDIWSEPGFAVSN